MRLVTRAALITELDTPRQKCRARALHVYLHRQYTYPAHSLERRACYCIRSTMSLSHRQRHSSRAVRGPPKLLLSAARALKASGELDSPSLYVYAYTSEPRRCFVHVVVDVCTASANSERDLVPRAVRFMSPLAYYVSPSFRCDVFLVSFILTCICIPHHLLLSLYLPLS